MALTARERRMAKIIGGVIGALLALTFFVAIPMAANYADHGSVFLVAHPGEGS